MDIVSYRKAPRRVLHMRVEVAEAWLRSHAGGPWAVASVDGVSRIVPSVVQILLHVEKGVVVRTELDRESFS